MNPSVSLLEAITESPPPLNIGNSQPSAPKTLLEKAFRAVRTVFQAAYQSVSPSDKAQDLSTNMRQKCWDLFSANALQILNRRIHRNSFINTAKI